MHSLRSGDCVSSNGNAVQLSVRTGAEATLALDNDVNTFSCTDDDQAFPWWLVDLGAEVMVASVQITLPTSNADDRNYINHLLTHRLTKPTSHMNGLFRIHAVDAISGLQLCEQYLPLLIWALTGFYQSGLIYEATL